MSIASLAGTPYAAAHCWGLVCLAYRQRGIELPSFDHVSEADLYTVARTIAPNAEGGPWMRVVGEWRAYDVVLMFGTPTLKSRRAIIHCGVVVDPNHVLHTERETDAVLVRRDNPTIRHRVAAVYRHVEIAERTTITVHNKSGRELRMEERRDAVDIIIGDA